MNTDFKPRWIKWDEESFLSDPIVRRMNKTQRDMYRLLILACYYGAFRPFLPDDDEELWMIAEAESIEHWLQNKPIIMKKFTKFTDGDGVALLQNKRVMEEWDALEAGLAQKKNAAAKSVAARRARVMKKSPHTPLKEENRLEEKRIERSTHVQRTFNGRSTDVQDVDNKTSLSPSASDLSDYVVSVAKKVAPEAAFTAKSKQSITDAITKINATKAELQATVTEMVGAMDQFTRKNAGNSLGASLVGAITTLRENVKPESEPQIDTAAIKAQIDAQYAEDMRELTVKQEAEAAAVANVDNWF